MLTVLRIPPPPLPAQVVALALGVGALLAGLVLLMAGRRLWRVIAGLALAGAALAAAPWASTLTKLSWQWMMLILAAVAGGLGVLLARVFWAALLAALLGAAALLGVIHLVAAGHIPPGSHELPAGFEAAGLMLADWAAMTCQTLGAWLWYLTHETSALAIGGGGLIAAGGLLVGLIYPVFARIFLTSLAGASLALGGVVLGILAVQSGFDFAAGHRPWVLLGIAGMLWLIGFSFQCHSERRDREKKKEQEKKDEPKKEAPPAAPKEPAKAGKK